MNNEQLNNNVINNGTTPNTPQNGNNTLNINSTQYVNNPEQAQRNNNKYQPLLQVVGLLLII